MVRNKVLILMVVIVLLGQGFIFSASAVDSSSEEEVSSEQKLILPSDELQEAFDALWIQQISPPVPMIDFTLENLAGEEIDTKTFQGKFIWINFWNTGCPPCIDEMPSMQKIWEKFGGSKFVLLAVNVGEKKSDVISLVEDKDNKWTFPVLLDRKGEIFQMYGARYFPSNLFINPEGEVIGTAVGGREWVNEKFYNFLQKLTETE